MRSALTRWWFVGDAFTCERLCLTPRLSHAIPKSAKPLWRHVGLNLWLFQPCTSTLTLFWSNIYHINAAAFASFLRISTCAAYCAT